MPPSNVSHVWRNIRFLLRAVPLHSAEDGLAEDNTAGVARIEDTGRLFVRNLSFGATEADLSEAFGKYGELSEVHMVLDKCGPALQNSTLPEKVFLLVGGTFYS